MGIATGGEGRFKPLYRLEFGMRLGPGGGIEIVQESLDPSCGTLLDIPYIADELRNLLEEARSRERVGMGD